MDTQFWTVLAIAAIAGAASPVGGLVAIWLRANTLLLSIAVGFAGGVLLGTFAFSMLPEAVEKASLPLTIAGFAVGVVLTLGFDLFVNRGQIAGEHADQNERVERFHKRRKPIGSSVLVLAGATSLEELIEGVAIGAGATVDMRLGMAVAFGIVVDNFSEALSIGELVREKSPGRYKAEVMRWTSLVGVALFVSAMAGWFLFGGMPERALGFVLALGAGGMFYLTVSQLVPDAQEHQFQGSGPLAVAAGFIVSLIVAQLS